jgi:hypothetical protein
MRAIKNGRPEKCQVCNERPAKMRAHYKGVRGWVCKICGAKTKALIEQQRVEAIRAK